MGNRLTPDMVVTLQTLLRDAGYGDKLVPDGVLNKPTLEALTALTVDVNLTTPDVRAETVKSPPGDEGVLHAMR